MSRGKTAAGEPTAEQLEAIECRDREIMVEAGAGTGKTRTTIARYRRLLADGHEPGQILVFTFTDKAAAELRSRVRETPEGEPEVAMGTAWIGTFHAICSRILRAHPVAADVDPRFDVLDEVKGRRIRDEAFERALKVVSEDRRSAEQLSRVPLVSWKTGVTAAYDQLRARGDRRPELPRARHEDQRADDFAIFCRGLVDRLLSAYGDEYSEMKQSEGLLDYEDLQLQTLSLLESHSGIRGSYEDRFVEIMVDEFQDTNRLQLGLIEALRGEQTTVFTVGDEMQAIYGFRHADVRLFRQRREQVGRPLGLTANFRSQAPVIGAVNLIGRGLDGQVEAARSENGTWTGDATVSRQEFTDLSVGLEPEPDRRASVEMIFVGAEGWREQDLGPLSPPDAKDQGKAEAATRAEALAVARRVRKAVDDGEVDISQVALLFRTKSNMPLHAEALAHYGLEPYIVGRSDFWASREAIDLRALLAVVANPLDDESLLSPLLGPACGLSSDTMVLLREASGQEPLWPALKAASRGDLTSISDEDCGRARSFVDAIETVRDSLATTPLGETVESVLAATGYDLACLGRGRPVERMANLRRLVSLAADYEASEGRDLRGFLGWAGDSSDLEAEGGVATEEESGQVVRLMTIHKAKGLEFDMVCVPDLGKGRRTPGSSVRICWIGPDGGDRGSLSGTAENEPDPSITFGLRINDEEGEEGRFFDWDAIRATAEIEQEDEELRLFHVAMTRARRLLVLSGAHAATGNGGSTGENTAGRLYRWALGCGTGEDGALPASIAVPAPAPGLQLESGAEASVITVEEIPAGPDNAARLGAGMDAGPGVDSGAAAGRPPLRRPDSSRRPDVPLSFTTLSVLADCPARFFATRVLKLEEPESAWAASDPEDREEVTLDPEETSPLTVHEATAFGSAVHELLEACAKRRWIRPTESEISARLAIRGLDGSDEELLARAGGMIYGFLDSPLGERVASQSCDVETPLLFDAGGITIRGFADLLARDASPPLILDYKSNNLEGTSAETKMSEQYSLQRDLYGLAVADGLGARTIDTAFVFLEDVANPVEMRLGPEGLARARAGVDDLVAMIRNGSFFGEPGAAAMPCGDCWACERLGPRLIGTRR